MLAIAGIIATTPAMAAGTGPRAQPDWPLPVHDDSNYGQVLFDRFEYQAGEDEDVLVWDAQAWYGGDTNRLWIETEGEDVRSGGDGGAIENFDVQYSHRFDRFWDVQAGLGYETTYGDETREQILGQSSFSTEESPPPFAAQFVDVTVDDRTGEFDVNRLAVAVDCGTAINPEMARGQVEGGNHMSFEMAVGEGVTFDDEGRAEVTDYDEYDLPTATETPPIDAMLVETHEPTGPFGAKSVAEVPTNTVPPALSNAIRDAVGVRVTEMPITAEKIKAALDDT